MRDAITQLQADGAKAFIMDIRNNGGGLFPAGVEIAQMWCDGWRGAGRRGPYADCAFPLEGWTRATSCSSRTAWA